MKLRFEFTLEEAHQLRAYAQARDQGMDAGWYYGNKGRFEQRHERILAELNNLTRSAHPTSEKQT